MMVQIFQYDERNVFTGSFFVDENDICDNMTRMNFVIGYIKPTFDTERVVWYEGATEEEIRDWYLEMGRQNNNLEVWK